MIFGSNRLLSTAESGSLAWPRPAAPGGYTLTHTAGGETLTAQFAVLGDDTIAIDSARLQSNAIWTTNKTWLITTALTVASGGSCTARGEIFTHVNDDTIGGDVLCDGSDAAAIMGDYTITGTITDDDSTEYRYMPPQTLTSNISALLAQP